MTFEQFCNMAENTEQEQQLFDFLNSDKMDSFDQAMVKLKYVPVIGKLMTAIAVLTDAESLAEFRQTENSQHIKNWEFSFDPDNGSFSLSPGEEHKKKAVKVISVISAVLGFLLLRRKLRRRKKKAK